MKNHRQLARQASLAVLVMLFAAAAPAAASLNVGYVDSNVADTHPCTRPSPCKTITQGSPQKTEYNVR
jgi:hypothetical protein